jgi:hypothetical protein
MGNPEFCGTFLSVSGLGLDWLNDVQVESTLAIEFALDVSRSLILAIHSHTHGLQGDVLDYQGARKQDARELRTPP